MNIKVQYFGQARSIAQIDCETITIGEAGLIRDVVAAVSTRHGEAMRDLLLSGDGSPRQSILTPINGKVAADDEPGLLKDADELAIYTPIAGG